MMIVITVVNRKRITSHNSNTIVRHRCINALTIATVMPSAMAIVDSITGVMSDVWTMSHTDVITIGARPDRINARSGVPDNAAAS